MRLLPLILVALLCAPAFGSEADDALQQAESLIEQGLPADALGFLSPAASLALVLAGSAVGLLGAWTSALRTDAEGLR